MIPFQEHFDNDYQAILFLKMESKMQLLIIHPFAILSEDNKESFGWIMKRTYNPSKLKRARKFGFRARMKTVGGRKVIRRRRKAGRHALAA